MGFCIMFPWLCGLKSIEVAEMKQIVIGVSDELSIALENEENPIARLDLIEEYRQKAIKCLEKTKKVTGGNNGTIRLYKGIILE